ncbi:hypothetical protein NHX12_034312 [Muraenolepis orangiensis]|uniref:RING-type domain-containing protein n=1 Tax=Muraenolepis orangiensis TaxID=630683 RepID=A0A9Q0I064_9TELE|nr:hypothetical protein NHX12_034312 [Muraenolepis orangiensis]
MASICSTRFYLCVPFLLWATSSWIQMFVTGERVAVVEVRVTAEEEEEEEEQRRLGVSAVLQGQLVVESPPDRLGKQQQHQHHDLEGDLILASHFVQDERPQVTQVEGEADAQRREPWIGVVPLKMEETKSFTGNQESFADTVVNKMRRALVLGASALIILALNHNTVSEMDLSQVLSKPIIVIQTSENVTKLIGALLRGLHATAKVTYKTILQDNLGATLTLWSSCGRSRGGLYGEWQGVICTGETNSQVQKYLQQLWNSVLLVAVVLSTGVLVQAHWQYQDEQLNEDLESSKQDILRRMSSLKTKTYCQPKPWCDSSQPMETENCAVCLEPFNNNQCLRVLPCRHEYHRDCVDPWLILQHTCPLCKRNILGNFCRDS